MSHQTAKRFEAPFPTRRLEFLRDKIQDKTIDIFVCFSTMNIPSEISTRIFPSESSESIQAFTQHRVYITYCETSKLF